MQVRQLREARVVVRVRRAAPFDSERGPKALGRVHYARDIVPLHSRVDRVGGSELLDCHKG